MIPSVFRPSCVRVGVFHLATGVIFGCLTFGAAQATTSPPVQDTYITLNLPGVVGDFTTVPNAPANSIQVLSLSTGASCFGTPTCSPSVSNLSLTKAADSASPKLFLALVTNLTYATATFNFWQAPTTGTNYTKTFTIYLTQAKLTSFQDGASEGVIPAESVSLNFTTIAFQDNVSGSVECYNVSTKATAAALTC
jgi:type VI protein secretion system component Hcp